jgi:hypothetical protein
MGLIGLESVKRDFVSISNLVRKQYAPIKRSARNCEFQKLRSGGEVGEFRYQPHRWKRPHRFVVVRRPIPQDPVEAGQLTLFKDNKYAYHVLVTNLRAHPWRVWRFYAPHATIEKNVRELLYDYPLGKIPTDDWVANVAFFQMLLFAFNLVHWFKRLCLPKDYLYATLDTIRTSFLVLPAKLTNQGGRNVSPAFPGQRVGHVRAPIVNSGGKPFPCSAYVDLLVLISSGVRCSIGSGAEVLDAKLSSSSTTVGSRAAGTSPCSADPAFGSAVLELVAAAGDRNNLGKSRRPKTEVCATRYLAPFFNQQSAIENLIAPCRSTVSVGSPLLGAQERNPFVCPWPGVGRTRSPHSFCPAPGWFRSAGS